MDFIKAIREFQNEINIEINNFCEKMIQELKNTENISTLEKEYVSTYPITNATFFKGKKPVEVLVNDQAISTPTWKKVVETILKEVIKDEVMESRMLGLRDIMAGRVRNRVSSSSTNMRSPLKITDKLYIESHYDTETLMKLLLTILNEINYDYDNIKIKIRN